MFMQFICDAPVLMGANYSTLTEKAAKDLTSGASIEIANKKSNESFITLKLDYTDLLEGEVVIGNGKTNGGTYLKIDKTVIKVYEIRDGKDVLVDTIEHELAMKEYISIAIHAKNGSAKVYAASSGFTGERLIGNTEILR